MKDEQTPRGAAFRPLRRLCAKTHRSGLKAAPRWHFAALLLLFQLAIGNWQSAMAQTPVMFPLSTMFGSTNYTKPFTLQAAQSFLTYGTNAWVGSSQTVTPSGGTNPIVYLTPNTYLVTFSDATYPWRIAVPNTANLQNAISLSTGPLPTFQTLPLTAAQTLALNNAVTNNSSGNSLGGTFTGDFSGPGFNMADSGSGAFQGTTLSVGSVSGALTATNGVVTAVSFAGSVGTSNLVGSLPASQLTGTEPLAVVNPSLLTNALYAAISDTIAWGSFMSTNAPFYPTGSDGTAKTGTNNVGFYALWQTNTSGAAVCNLRLAYQNNPPVSIGGLAPANATNAITVDAAIEYPPGVFTRVTFNGGNYVTIATNQWAVVSDPVSLTITNGAGFRIRNYVTTFANCGFPVYSLAEQFGGNNDGYLLGAAAFDATMTSASLNSGQLWSYGPAVVLAQRIGVANATAPTSVAIVGDSRVNSDSWLYYKLTGMQLPVVQVATVGNSFELETNVMKWDQPLILASCSTIFCELNVNSIYANGDSFQQLTNAIVAWATPYVQAGKRIFLATCLPYTTSSDNWTTLANQSQESTAQNAVRVQFNNWVRQGCAGVPGIVGYLEMADVLESQRDSGLWRVDLGQITSDGLHPNTLGYSYLTTNLDISPLLGTLLPAEPSTNLFGAYRYAAVAQRRPNVISLEASNIVLNVDDTGVAGNQILFNFHSGGSAFTVNDASVYLNGGANISGTLYSYSGVNDEGASSSLDAYAQFSHLWRLRSVSGPPDLVGTNGTVICATNFVANTGITYATNVWSLANATNGMNNFQYRITSSNSTALVSIWISNGAPYIKNLSLTGQ